jgi:hypothetical protein
LSSAQCKQGQKKYTGCPENNGRDQRVDLQHVQHGSPLPVAELATDSVNDEQKACSQQSGEKNENRKEFVEHEHLRIDARYKCNVDTKGKIGTEGSPLLARRGGAKRRGGGSSTAPN